MAKPALEKALAARQREFDDLKKEGKRNIRDLVDRCEQLTAMAGDELEALVNAAEACLVVDRETEDRLYDSTNAAMRRLSEQAEAKRKSGAATPGDAAYFDIMATTYELRRDRLKEISEQRAREQREVGAFARLLTEEILSKRASTFAKDSFWAAFHTGAGAVPILGTVYSATKAVVDVAQKRGERIRTATAVVNALDDYADALTGWIQAARLLTAELEVRAGNAP